MDELHQRAAAQAAAAVGLSHSAAMAAMPLLPDMQDNAQVSFAMASLAPMVRRYRPVSHGRVLAHLSVLAAALSATGYWSSRATN